jgi:VWFA-related protein
VRRRGVLLIALVGVVLCSNGTAGQERRVFRGASDAVLVDVSVLDGKRPVAGLGKSDFRLLDDGVAQVIDDVSQGQIPLDISLLVDTSYSIGHPTAGSVRYFTHNQPATAWVRAGVTRLIGMLTPVDRLQVLAFATAIAEVGPGPRGQLALDPPGRGEKSQRTALFDAISAALMEPEEVGRRHLVVVLTDGLDTASVVDDSVRGQVLARSDAPVFIVAAGSREFSTIRRPPPLDTLLIRPGDLSNSNWAVPFGGYDWILRDIATRTDGQLYVSESSDDFANKLADAVNGFRSRYLLTFQPRGVAATGWHRLTVLVSRGSYVVRARHGYFGGPG